MPLTRAEYEITVSDFRKASYYGLFLRYRRPFLALFIVVAGALLYALAAALGLGDPNPLVFFLAGAYAIWGLVMAAGVERSIRAYLAAPDRLVGCAFAVTLDERQLHLTVPARGIQVSCAWEKLACAFELHALFLLYSTPQQVWLLPKRALSPEEAAALRALLRARLGDRFGTRFR